MSGFLTTGSVIPTAKRAWLSFFFTPTDPSLVGLLRIFLGLLLTWDLTVLGIDLRDYLGSDGWIGPKAGIQYLENFVPGAWSIWFWIGDDYLYLAWSISIMVAVAFTLGFFGRITSILSWIILSSTIRRMPVALYGFDQTLAMWIFYLAVFGSSSDAFSLDNFFKRRKMRKHRAQTHPVEIQANIDRNRPEAGTTGSTLTLRLIQIHLAIIYGSSGYWKLLSPDWTGGQALSLLILTPEFRRFDFSWLMAYPRLLSGMTYTGLLIELIYPLSIWFRKTRVATICMAISMHLAIDLFLGLSEFSLVMIVANLAFLPPQLFRK